MAVACVISIGMIELVLPVRDAVPAKGRLSILCPQDVFTPRPGRRSAFSVAAKMASASRGSSTESWARETCLEQPMLCTGAKLIYFFRH